MFSKTLLFFLVTCCGGMLLAQANDEESFLLSGNVLDANTRDPLVFVNVFFKHSQKGTISNGDGYFSISSNHLGDTLTFSYVGYQRKSMACRDLRNLKTVKLVPLSLQFDEVIIRSDNSYLFEILTSSKKYASEQQNSSKAYFQLETFVNEQQVELVECYFNGSYRGYDIGQLDLKTGRIGLQLYDDRAFVSTEGSRAVSMLKLFERNDFFPNTPLTVSKSEMKRQFDLRLFKKYHTAEMKAVYIIEFVPKVHNGNFFTGKIWVEQEGSKILRMDLHIADAKKHPFLPMFSDDSILTVDMDISKSFVESDQGMCLEHVDFNYRIHYSSRDSLVYTVSTSAVLQAYSFGDLFFLPKFNFATNIQGDYRKINAIPYNEYFWMHSDEFRLADSQDRNAKFFSDSLTVSNTHLFRANAFGKRGLLEHPYVAWNGNRIKFREYVPDSLDVDARTQVVSASKYNFSVQLLMDATVVQDSLICLTATIFDPYESYYHLEMDQKAQCFVNMYFDLVECERRALEGELASVKDFATAEFLYNKHVRALNSMTQTFLREVDRGQNQTAMERWNDFIAERLEIDNVRIFNPYQ